MRVLYFLLCTVWTALANIYSLDDCVLGISGGYKLHAHFCASILASGGGFRVRCWGDNSFMQLGTLVADSSILSAASRSDLTFPPGKNVLRTFNGDVMNCASFDDDTFGCWGKIVESTVSSTSATIMSGVGPVEDACIGLNHLCVVVSGSVRCSGNAFFGQIGSGDSANVNFPSSIEVDLGDLGSGVLVEGVVCGEQHTCVLTSNGKVKCWGLKIVLGLELSPSGFDFGLGNGAGEMGDALPFVDFGEVEAVDITAHSLHTCVLTSGGSVKCWGDVSEIGGSGVVGDAAGEMGSSLSSWNIGSLSPGVTISGVYTGVDFLLSFLSNGEVRRGSASFNFDRDDPVGFSAWASAMQTICVVMRDYNVRCYGSNQRGALGIGVSGGVTSFVDVAMGPGSGFCGCPGGNILNVSGVPQCTVCAGGNFSVGGVSTVCSVCGWGEFSASPGSSACNDCVAGSYQSGYGATACSLCEKGEVIASSRGVQCVACAAGTYSDVEGGTACSLCLAGTYGETVGATSATECTACDAGSFTDSGGKTVCTTCGRGSYAASPGLTACTDCLAGKFFAGFGAASESLCTPCGAGEYGPSTGASVCYSCGIGEYSNAGQSGCTACEAGKFGNFSRNGVGCELCGISSFSGGSGSSVCTLCPPGSFATVGGLSTVLDCTLCGVGSVSGAAGSTHCDTCGLGEYAVLGGTVCESCDVGFFGNVTGLGECFPLTECIPGNYMVSD